MIPRHPSVYRSHALTMDVPLGNAFLSLVLLVLIVLLLVRYNRQYNAAERLGHGMAGASMFLSIFKQLGFSDLMLPFNDWYQLLWRLGWLFLLGGKLWRLERHDRANKAAVRQAKRHFADRGEP